MNQRLSINNQRILMVYQSRFFLRNPANTVKKYITRIYKNKKTVYNRNTLKGNNNGKNHQK